MTTYRPNPYDIAGMRPTCAECGAAYRLHRVEPGQVARTTCPTPAPASTSLDDAIASLLRAAERHDTGLVFTYRGEVQRYMDHRPLPTDHCHACSALEMTR